MKNFFLGITSFLLVSCTPEYIPNIFGKLRSPFVRYICKGEPQPGKTANGVVGRLYLDPANASYFDALDVAFHSSFSSGIGLYADAINDPPRDFREGFTIYDTIDHSERPLTRASGDLLLEHYGLHYRGRLKTSLQDAGYYSFAMISDDGMNLRIDSNEILENGDIHGPTVDCHLPGVSALYIGEQGVDLESYYYQGPGTRIASSLYWRKETQPTFVPPASCGLRVNDGTQLEDEGYRLIPAENYYISAQDLSYNPCNN